jgi:putative membrane protein
MRTPRVGSAAAVLSAVAMLAAVAVPAAATSAAGATSSATAAPAAAAPAAPPTAGGAGPAAKPPAPQATSAGAAEAAATFFRFAHSASRLQWHAADLALRKQARPEVRALAERTLAFRRPQWEAIEALAARRGHQLPALMEFEHAIILENLEPLDLLAFSRRFSEVMAQSLQQEIDLYRGYVAHPEAVPELSSFARESLPRLENELQGTREVLAATRN